MTNEFDDGVVGGQPVEQPVPEPRFKKDDIVLFHNYGETEEHEGIVLEAPESGKLTVQFEDLGTMKINSCYLKKA